MALMAVLYLKSCFLKIIFKQPENISVENFSLKSDKRLVRLYADIFLDIIYKLVKK